MNDELTCFGCVNFNYKFGSYGLGSFGARLGSLFCTAGCGLISVAVVVPVALLVAWACSDSAGGESLDAVAVAVLALVAGMADWWQAKKTKQKTATTIISNMKWHKTTETAKIKVSS